MINSIKIKNFETHLDTEIFLHKGTNVLIGESDEGKSGIRRAIEWNTQNRPRGDSYRNDQLDPQKDKLKDTSVAIDYKSSSIVTRQRNGVSGGVNNYQIGTKEPLRALKTDVPDEVQEITKMKAVNIQGQHPSEQYFLLADKPGQVAKEFNKVAGLTIMDKATGDINSQVRTCNTEIKIAKKEIENFQEEIQDTEWVDAAEKSANKLKDFKLDINKKKEKRKHLHDKIITIKEISKKLTRFNKMDEALEELIYLNKQKVDIDLKNNTSLAIIELISSIKSVDLSLLNTVDTEKALTALKELKTAKQNIEQDEEKIEEINNLVLKIKENKEAIQKSELEIALTLKDYDKIKEKQRCPVCGRKG